MSTIAHHLTYEVGDAETYVQPEQRIGTIVIWPILMSAVASIIVTILITLRSPMHG
ncbi:MAG: hypothetical protein HOV81_06955 [Kofleriaceae bacterium]|nr:hypothetical protein [Kofleriaceae bacterium]